MLRVGPRRAAFIWGADLGFGFTTIRIASIYWIAVLTAFFFEAPSAAAISFGFYGIGLAINLIIGITIMRRRFGNGVIWAATGLRSRIAHAAAIGLASGGLTLVAAGALGA